MATTNGLPTLKIAFEKAAAQVANRSKKGYAAVFVRDSNAQGVHLLSSDALIPSNLGEDNKKHEAGLRGLRPGAPSLVILVVIAPAPRTPPPWRAASRPSSSTPSTIWPVRPT